jgi:hypothetical protein
MRCGEISALGRLTCLNSVNRIKGEIGPPSGPPSKAPKPKNFNFKNFNL